TGGQHLCAGFTSSRTCLLNSRNSRREIEVLRERTLNDARQNRIAEPRPPGLDRRSRNVGLPGRHRGGVVELGKGRLGRTFVLRYHRASREHEAKGQEGRTSPQGKVSHRAEPLEAPPQPPH